MSLCRTSPMFERFEVYGSLALFDASSSCGVDLLDCVGSEALGGYSNSITGVRYLMIIASESNIGTL